MRIAEHPILSFADKRKEEVSFTFNGKEITGYKGEPIAAALQAAGYRVLSHSLQLHRPRGFFCAIGNCSSCMMKVNGVPNVKVCQTPLEVGMEVETQEGKGDLGA
ncbi:MAG: (2Fe-2S)-binding protein [Halanaerobium sp.]|nr:(2Fe-2S)-binding protein [Halanaerobium sp.]